MGVPGTQQRRNWAAVAKLSGMQLAFLLHGGPASTGIKPSCMSHPPFFQTELQDVRAAEVNRLTLQSGKGVWLLLEPRDGAQADASVAAVVGAAAGAAH